MAGLSWRELSLIQRPKKISETTVSPLLYSDYSLNVKYFLLRRDFSSYYST